MPSLSLIPPAEDHAAHIRAVASSADRNAFGALFRHFAPRVKTLLMRAGASAASAEEIAQETMLTVWRKAGQFDVDRASAATWIFTIARNLRIDRARKDLRAQAGVATLERIEILEGLKPDQQVCLEDPTKKKVEKDDDN